MNSAMFWILVFPVLLVAVLYFLSYLVLGTGMVIAGSESRRGIRRVALILIGTCVVATPFALEFHLETQAQRRADERQAELAALERTSLEGRLPARYIALNALVPAEIEIIEQRHGLRRFDEGKEARLRAAYRQFRKAEFCNRHFAGQTMPGTALSVCRPLPASLHDAMATDEAFLVIATDHDTSLRQSNTVVGKMYEIRLITPQEDLLIDYFEERTVLRPPGITNPFSSGVRLASDGRPPHRAEFIRAALKGASPCRPRRPGETACS